MSIGLILVSCPHCAASLNGHRPADGGGALPKSGDPTVCGHCLEVAVFEAGPFGLALRVPTPQEAAVFGADPQLAQVRAFAVEVARERQRRGGGL